VQLGPWHSRGRDAIFEPHAPYLLLR
jgi:hypothetical protein